MKISGVFRYAFKKESIIAVLCLLFTGFAYAGGVFARLKSFYALAEAQSTQG